MKEIKLYKHNQETYDKIIDAWKTENKVAVIQATGTGKSYIILKCLYDFINKKKVVLAPSTYILEQLEREGGELENITLLTYTKLSYMSNEDIKHLNPSLIVFDEFHRCGADSWGTGVSKLIESFPNAKILGTSATNIRYLDNNRDMADEIFEGNVVTNLSLAEAIVKDVLPMPKYVSALYTFNDEINNLKNKVENSKNTDEDKEKLFKEIEKMKNNLEISKGIPQIFKKHLNDSNYKFIVFCKNIEHLNEMKDIVVDWFKTSKISKMIKSYTAYAEYDNTNKEVEEFRLNNKKNTIKLLFSIDMFNEGIHIKDVSGVILLRPTISPIIYYQQIGRAIQVGKNNNPIIFDFVNNFDNIGAKKFIGDLKEYTRIEKENKKKNIIDSTDIDIYEFMIFDEIQEAKALFENIEDKLISNWEAMYEELKDFYSKNGHCNVEKSYDYKLYNWVKNQRNHEISKEKKIKLNQLNFKWEKLSKENEWNKMYEKLKCFYDKYGNSEVFKSYDFQLYKWLSGQKTAYRIGKLKTDKIILLEKLNFKWEIPNEIWNSMYNLLEEYYKTNGNSDIPEDKKLNKWVQTQRNRYATNQLNKERIQQLKKLKFSWNLKLKAWDDMYSELLNYFNKNHHCNVTKKENVKLYNFIIRQRLDNERGKLTNDKIKKLEKLNFSFETNNTRWEYMFNILSEYIKENENSEIKKDCLFQNEELGKWFFVQKRAFNEKTINRERLIKLRTLGLFDNQED